jgi:hypothetical protein
VTAEAEVRTAAPSARTALPYPSIPAVVFAIWALVVPLAFSDRVLNADGDMLRHLRHGRWMLEHGALIHHDPFSYTRGGDPFVGFEYGSQVVYALIHQVSGLAGVAIFAGFLIAASYAVLVRFMLARGADPLLTYLVSIVAAVLGAVHWIARPHLFTLLGVILLLHVLEPGARRVPPWLMAPAFALWANLHGGWVFGCVLLGICLAGSLVEWRFGRGRDEWRERTRYYALALAFALAGTLLTPHGIELHRHIIAFFGEPFLRDNTHEFMSPDFHQPGAKMFLVVLLALIGLVILVPGRPTWPRLLLLLANVAFTLQARRNIPLFAAIVVPIMALHFDAAWRALPDWRGIRAIFERDARRGSTAVFVACVVVPLAVLAALRGRVAGRELVYDRLDRREFPVDVVARARSAGVQGRVFHDFIWGGYILYAWPEQKVFIDGGTDFYGTDLMRTYIDVSGIQPGWRDTLASREIDLVLMPTGSPMAHELAHDGWRVRDCDATAALLQRDSTSSESPARLRSCADPGSGEASGTGP